LEHAFASDPASLRRAWPRVPFLYAAEAVGAISGALLTVGLPFFTHHRFGWDARDNFLLGAGQGVVYVLGALSAQPMAQRWGRRTSLVALYVLLTLLGMAIAWTAVTGPPALLVALVLGEMALVAATWPLLESLVSVGAGPEDLSRQLGVYNLTWAIAGSLTVALSGTVIQYAAPWAFFAIVAGGHLGALGLVLPVSDDPHQPVERPTAGRCAVDPELFRQRRLALWLSRISLPATYVVVYSLAPVFPSLPALQAFSPATATVLASVWLVGRAVAFVVTGQTTFWHTRPRLLLGASVVMLLGFLGTVVPPTLVGLPLGPIVGVMVVAQVALGLSLGLIYAGSLYFGMVLSEGSTEHGGYHEALIGLGQVLGPGVGAAVLWAYPGSLGASIGAVSGLLSVSLVVTAAKHHSRGRRQLRGGRAG
jgi:MFS family permease